MSLILNNTPDNHFNSPILKYNHNEFYIINEESRKLLVNLFDSLGNIASYNDYNAFFRRFKYFSKFKGCKCSKLLRKKLEKNQGLVIINRDCSMNIELFSDDLERWFIFNYTKVYNISIDCFVRNNQVPLDYLKIFSSTDFKNDDTKPLNSLLEASHIKDANNTSDSDNSDDVKVNLNNKKIDELAVPFKDANNTSDSDNSDDVKAYLNNKKIDELAVPFKNDKTIVERSNDIALSSLLDTCKNESSEDQLDNTVEQLDNIINEIQSNNNTLAKELFEKHGKISNDAQQTYTYTNKFWSILGWS